MNREQAKVVMETIRAAYPNAYKGLDVASMKTIVSMWAVMFAADDPALVMAAVKGHIATCKFAPQISEIKAMMRTISQPADLTEIEAWSLVKKAIRNSAWSAVEEHSKLPEIIQRLVPPEQLRDWALSKMEDEQVVSSNFMRSYRVRAKQAAEIEALPADVKVMIETGVLKIGHGKGGQDENTETI